MKSFTNQYKPHPFIGFLFIPYKKLFSALKQSIHCRTFKYCWKWNTERGNFLNMKPKIENKTFINFVYYDTRHIVHAFGRIGVKAILNYHAILMRENFSYPPTLTTYYEKFLGCGQKHTWHWDQVICICHIEKRKLRHFSIML